MFDEYSVALSTADVAVIPEAEALLTPPAGQYVLNELFDAWFSHSAQTQFVERATLEMRISSREPLK
jgi:hypothetical protein